MMVARQQQLRHRVVVGLAVIMITAAIAVTVGTPQPAGADPAPPRPVFPLSGGGAADPGLTTDGDRYYAFVTGGLARTVSAETPQGSWTEHGDALSRWPSWAAGDGAVWAPDAIKTPAGWVLYYAVIAEGFDGQRCIGTAIADSPTGPYEPSDDPLICPVLGGEDPAADRPDPTSGVIDPSPFVDDDGRFYLLYKTQRTPGTIRMVELTPDGLHVAGPPSRELWRQQDSIENPTMVKRGDHYVLFAASNWYDQCRYSTVWRRSTDLWSFADKPEHTLLDQQRTGICGPGGADVISTGGDTPNRMLLQGWVCDQANTPCVQPEGPVQHPDRRRVLYAAVLTWGDDGATPRVPHFLPPTGTRSVTVDSSSRHRTATVRG